MKIGKRKKLFNSCATTKVDSLVREISDEKEDLKKIKIRVKNFGEKISIGNRNKILNELIQKMIDIKSQRN